MKSLRVQLLWGTALGTTAVLLVCGVVLYALLGRALWAEYDAALAAQARSLTALAEQEQEGLEFELSEVALPEFEPSDHAEYYQVWLPDGSVFARSPSLDTADLRRISGTMDSPGYATVTLPDGRPGRLVGMTFSPRREEEEKHNDAPAGVTLVLGRDTLGLQATLARVRGILITVCVVAVLLSAAVLATVVRRSVRPIDHLSTRIMAVGEDDLSTRIAVPGIPQELSPVVVRLNELLARLDAAFQRERRFTGDVAHELRNPLAGLRSTLELALSRDRAPEAYRKAMGDCLAINLQMQRTVENLLHLARADAGQLDIRCEQVDLSEVLRHCWQSLREKADARGLRVEWRLQGPGRAQTDGNKLRLVVHNILDNAVAYVDEQGHISVSMSPRNGCIILAVSNTGSDLHDDQMHRVFDRFWRADPSCGRSGEVHCGLGLPLCKAVLEQLGGAIEATTSTDRVFTVTLSVPSTAAAKPDRGRQCGGNT